MLLGFAFSKKGDMYLLLSFKGIHISYHASGKVHLKGSGIYRDLGFWRGRTHGEAYNEAVRALKDLTRKYIVEPCGRKVIAFPQVFSKDNVRKIVELMYKRKELVLNVRLADFEKIIPSSLTCYILRDYDLPKISVIYGSDLLVFNKDSEEFFSWKGSIGIRMPNRVNELHEFAREFIEILDKISGLRLLTPIYIGLKYLSSRIAEINIEKGEEVLEKKMHQVLRKVKFKIIDLT